MRASNGKEKYKDIEENVVEDREWRGRWELLGYEFCIYSGSNGSCLRAVSRRVIGFLYSFKDHSGCRV